MLLSFQETAALLKKNLIPLVKSFWSKNYGDIVRAAAGMEPPLVLKVISSVSHKKGKGLVYLGIHDREELEVAYKMVSRNAAGLEIDAFLLQEQATGVELIVGGKEDPSFGKTVLFGLGGTFADLLKQFSIRVTPVSALEAKKMVDETKAHDIVHGFHGMKIGEEGIVDIIVKTSKMLEENPEISAVDFNPVMANEKNAVVVDPKVFVGGME
jgi:acetyl-CoA synthetase (ADP-forming)